MNKKYVYGGLIFLLICAIGYCFMHSLYDYNTQNIHAGISIEHPLGTDFMGRDNLYRLLIASCVSLWIAISATILAVFLSIFVGGISGYCGGLVDHICMRICEVMMILPTLPILLVLNLVFKDFFASFIVLPCLIALFTWVEGAKLIRSQIRTLSKQEFVLASEVLGGSPFHIVYHHLIRNVREIIRTNIMLVLARAILLESSLSFLGFGLQVQIPSLGKLVNLARDSDILLHYPLDYLPAALICFLIVYFINRKMKEK